MHDPSPAVRGMAIATLGGFILSFDVLLIRLADGDVWSVMAARCGAVFAFGLVALLVAPMLGYRAMRLSFAPAALLATACYATSTLFFIASSFHTSAANLVFIVAFTPALSAIAGRLFMGEHLRWPTAAAIAAMVAGVGLIVRDGFVAGNTLGDLMAVIVAMALTGAILLTRHHALDMRLNVLMANAPVALLGLVMAVASGGLQVEAPIWSLINGGIVIPLSFLCLAYAPLVLPGTIVAMFYLIETVLAPIWVWLFLDDAPTSGALAGGAILLAALFAHSAWLARRDRRRDGPAAA